MNWKGAKRVVGVPGPTGDVGPGHDSHLTLV
jgi:hypothetical protein